MMYNYNELKEKALKSGSTREDRLALLDWFEKYGASMDWNGEYWYIEKGLGLYPIYEEVKEDVFDIVDAEIR